MSLVRGILPYDRLTTQRRNQTHTLIRVPQAMSDAGGTLSTWAGGCVRVRDGNRSIVLALSFSEETNGGMTYL